MQPILGMPILGRVMESLYAHGIEDFIVVLNPFDDQACKYLKKELILPINLKIINQDAPLGTGHALQQAAPFIQGSFILSACDNLIMFDELGIFIEHWMSIKSDALLTLMEVSKEQIPRTGIVELEDRRVINIYEKPELDKAPSNIASLPLYIFSAKILHHLNSMKISPRLEYELQDAIQNMIDQNADIQGFPISQRLSLTTPEDLLLINRDFLSRERPPYLNIQSNSIGVKTRFIPPVHIETGVTIGSNCIIGPEVYIEEGTSLGDRVTAEKSIVLEGAELPDNVKISDTIVLNNNEWASRSGDREFSRPIDRYFQISANSIIHANGLIDHLAGDEALGTFVPGLAGPNFALQALESS